MQNPNLLYNAAHYAELTERPGRAADPDILDIIHELFPGWRDDTTLPWCSCFTHLIARNCCVENPADAGHAHPGMARSWLSVGEVVTKPLPGDIVVFWRGSPNSGSGHVGFYLAERDDDIIVYGGNQSNRVTISRYAKNRLLGYRRLRTIEPNHHV